MITFKAYIAENTIPVGLCYKYAYQRIMKDDKLTLVHATVHNPWDGKAYVHAWVEEGNLVQDWQTMEAGSSKYAKKGWPVKEYYAAFNPKDIKKYNQVETMKNAAKGKHYGPW